jgi:hypothetical protein
MSSLVLVSQSLLNKMESSVSDIESNEYVLEAKLIPLMRPVETMNTLSFCHQWNVCTRLSDCFK